MFTKNQLFVAALAASTASAATVNLIASACTAGACGPSQAQNSTVIVTLGVNTTDLELPVSTLFVSGAAGIDVSKVECLVCLDNGFCNTVDSTGPAAYSTNEVEISSILCYDASSSQVHAGSVEVGTATTSGALETSLMGTVTTSEPITPTPIAVNGTASAGNGTITPGGSVRTSSTTQITTTDSAGHTTVMTSTLGASGTAATASSTSTNGTSTGGAEGMGANVFGGLAALAGVIAYAL